jgi:hypothetical protein
MKFFRITETTGRSFWFLKKGEARILDFDVVVGFRVNRFGDGDMSKAHMISVELIASQKEARLISEFTCGHRSFENVNGKCPRCSETKTGNFCDSVLAVIPKNKGEKNA